MGTHPIFESDFDCLTVFREMSSGVAQIGAKAPPFTCQALVNGEFKSVSLSDYEGKYVVLFFYPLNFKFVCPTEIIAFSEASDQFKQLNCQVIAASTDSVYSHCAWTNQDRKQGGLGKMKIPILADTNHQISKAYDCLKEDEGIAFRGLYIIDKNGILRQITINDLPVGRSVEETLRLVHAFQFVDENGEVCPAGWRPGADSMKADPMGSKEYFNKQ